MGCKLMDLEKVQRKSHPRLETVTHPAFRHALLWKTFLQELNVWNSRSRATGWKSLFRRGGRRRCSRLADFVGGSASAECFAGSSSFLLSSSSSSHKQLVLPVSSIGYCDSLSSAIKSSKDLVARPHCSLNRSLEERWGICHCWCLFVVLPGEFACSMHETFAVVVCFQ